MAIEIEDVEAEVRRQGLDGWEITVVHHTYDDGTDVMLTRGSRAVRQRWDGGELVLLTLAVLPRYVQAKLMLSRLLAEATWGEEG